jgi:hypothetical protein
VYPVILTTNVRLLEQRSETVTHVERSLSVYISDLRLHAAGLVDSATSCPGWELADTLCMTTSLEALARGDYSELLEQDIYDRSDAGIEETYFDPFAEGEKDDGVYKFSLLISY